MGIGIDEFIANYEVWISICKLRALARACRRVNIPEKNIYSDNRRTDSQYDGPSSNIQQPFNTLTIS
jgi:hypothetical protein